MAKAVGLAILLTGIGAGLIVVGIRIQKGLDRSWWIASRIHTGQAPFVLFPGGAGLILLAIGALSPWDWLQLFSIGAFLLSGLVAGVFWAIRPRFLKPEWLKRIEDNHRDIIPILRREALRMGYRQWFNRTRTPSGMEDWVAEVRRKHGLE